MHSLPGIPPLAARTGTWLQLVQEAPPSVLAASLGINPATAMRYANLAGADYLAYARLRRPAGDAAELDLIPSYQRTACRHRWGPDARD